jgi:hypothetical protein
MAPSSDTPMPCRSANGPPTVTRSIYVHQAHLHSGVGRRLLPALIETCAAARYRQMVAYIDRANLPTIELHRAHDLRRAGLLLSVGFKFGRWTDTLRMPRALGVGDSAPSDDRAGKTARPRQPSWIDRWSPLERCWGADGHARFIPQSHT